MRQRFKKVAEAVYFGPKPEPVAPLPATIPVSMQKRYWTKKRCKEEARKHKTFSQFRKNCASAYAIAWRNGWLDEIHEIFGNKERKGRKV